MNIYSYLNEVLLTMIYFYLNLGNTKYDEMMIDEDGNRIGAIEFMKLHYDIVLDDEIIDGVVAHIRDIGLPNSINKISFISYLARYYYLYSYGSNESVLKYLVNTPKEEVFQLFLDNEDFAMDMIRTYYKALMDDKRIDENKEQIMKDGKVNDVLLLERDYMHSSYVSLTNLLRRVVCNLYNEFISNGYSEEEALEALWSYFFDNFDPINELGRYGFKENDKGAIKVYMLWIIYGDLYEDICNESIISSEDVVGFAESAIPLVSVSYGKLFIPIDKKIRNRLFKHFIMLQDNMDKVRLNRRETEKSGRVKELKKVNPLYFLDELT